MCTWRITNDDKFGLNSFIVGVNTCMDKYKIGDTT